MHEYVLRLVLALIVGEPGPWTMKVIAAVVEVAETQHDARLLIATAFRETRFRASREAIEHSAWGLRCCGWRAGMRMDEGAAIARRILRWGLRRSGSQHGSFRAYYSGLTRAPHHLHGRRRRIVRRIWRSSEHYARAVETTLRMLERVE